MMARAISRCAIKIICSITFQLLAERLNTLFTAVHYRVTVLSRPSGAYYCQELPGVQRGTTHQGTIYIRLAK